MSSPVPDFKAFNLALIQLGHIGADKAANLKHAKEMILTAARAGGTSDKKPSLVVLPVRVSHSQSSAYYNQDGSRNALTHRMGMFISPCMPKR